MNSSGLPTAAAIVDTLRYPRPSVERDGRAKRWAGSSIRFWLCIAATPSNGTGRTMSAGTTPTTTWSRTAKRDIDQLNRDRHALIEAIDRAILHAIEPSVEAPRHRNPGMAIDRLSVLVIRLASTEAVAASGPADAGLVSERLPRLRSQLASLEEAIATLLIDLTHGTRRFIGHQSLSSTGRTVAAQAADGGQRHRWSW